MHLLIQVDILHDFHRFPATIEAMRAEITRLIEEGRQQGYEIEAHDCAEELASAEALAAWTKSDGGLVCARTHNSLHGASIYAYAYEDATTESGQS